MLRRHKTKPDKANKELARQEKARGTHQRPPLFNPRTLGRPKRLSYSEQLLIQACIILYIIGQVRALQDAPAPSSEKSLVKKKSAAIPLNIQLGSIYYQPASKVSHRSSVKRSKAKQHTPKILPQLTSFSQVFATMDPTSQKNIQSFIRYIHSRYQEMKESVYHCLSADFSDQIDHTHYAFIENYCAEKEKSALERYHNIIIEFSHLTTSAKVHHFSYTDLIFSDERLIEQLNIDEFELYTSILGVKSGNIPCISYITEQANHSMLENFQINSQQRFNKLLADLQAYTDHALNVDIEDFDTTIDSMIKNVHVTSYIVDFLELQQHHIYQGAKQQALIKHLQKNSQAFTISVESLINFYHSLIESLYKDFYENFAHNMEYILGQKRPILIYHAQDVHKRLSTGQATLSQEELDWYFQNSLYELAELNANIKATQALFFKENSNALFQPSADQIRISIKKNLPNRFTKTKEIKSPFELTLSNLDNISQKLIKDFIQYLHQRCLNWKNNLRMIIQEAGSKDNPLMSDYLADLETEYIKISHQQSLMFQEKINNELNTKQIKHFYPHQMIAYAQSLNANLNQYENFFLKEFFLLKDTSEHSIHTILLSFKEILNYFDQESKKLILDLASKIKQMVVNQQKKIEDFIKETITSLPYFDTSETIDLSAYFKLNKNENLLINQLPKHYPINQVPKDVALEYALQLNQLHFQETQEHVLKLLTNMLNAQKPKKNFISAFAEFDNSGNLGFFGQDEYDWFIDLCHTELLHLNPHPHSSNLLSNSAESTKNLSPKRKFKVDAIISQNTLTESVSQLSDKQENVRQLDQPNKVNQYPRYALIGFIAAIIFFLLAYISMPSPKRRKTSSTPPNNTLKKNEHSSPESNSSQNTSNPSPKKQKKYKSIMGNRTSKKTSSVSLDLPDNSCSPEQRALAIAKNHLQLHVAEFSHCLDRAMQILDHSKNYNQFKINSNKKNGLGKAREALQKLTDPSFSDDIHAKYNALSHDKLEEIKQFDASLVQTIAKIKQLIESIHSSMASHDKLQGPVFPFKKKDKDPSQIQPKKPMPAKPLAATSSAHAQIKSKTKPPKEEPKKSMAKAESLPPNSGKVTLHPFASQTHPAPSPRAPSPLPSLFSVKKPPLPKNTSSSTKKLSPALIQKNLTEKFTALINRFSYHLDRYISSDEPSPNSFELETGKRMYLHHLMKLSEFFLKQDTQDKTSFSSFRNQLVHAHHHLNAHEVFSLISEFNQHMKHHDPHQLMQQGRQALVAAIQSMPVAETSLTLSFKQKISWSETETIYSYIQQEENKLARQQLRDALQQDLNYLTDIYDEKFKKHLDLQESYHSIVTHLNTHEKDVLEALEFSIVCIFEKLLILEYQNDRNAIRNAYPQLTKLRNIISHELSSLNAGQIADFFTKILPKINEQLNPQPDAPLTLRK